jgi:hypothetical protein
MTRTEWANGHLPSLRVDSVIGTASGYPVTDTAFLQTMARHWFAPLDPVSREK